MTRLGEKTRQFLLRGRDAVVVMNPQSKSLFNLINGTGDPFSA
jgi:hypothetical protein